MYDAVDDVLTRCAIVYLLKNGSKVPDKPEDAKKFTIYAKVIAGTKAKGNLNEKQEAFIQKREKTLALLNHAYPRPSRPLYQGQPSLLAGISYGLDKPATLAIVDLQTGKAITSRSIRQLLGENYKLLNRSRLRQQRNAHRRHNSRDRFSSERQVESLSAIDIPATVVDCDCLSARDELKETSSNNIEIYASVRIFKYT